MTKLTIAQKQEILAKYEMACANNDRLGTVKRLAEEFGVSRWTIQNLIAGRGNTNAKLIQGVLMDGETVRARSIDIDAQGNVVRQWIKTQHDDRQIMMKQVIEAMTERLPKLPPIKIEPIPKPEQRHPELLACIPIGDPHIGLLASEAQTGENFDLHKGAEILRKAVQRLVASAPACDEALLISLGDYFHADLMDNKTWRNKHDLDVSHTWADVLKVGIEVMIDLVRYCLARHRRVTVICAIGNHDDHSTIWLQAVLAHAFAGNPRVTIIDEPKIKHYYRFGANLIGVHHGHTLKKADLPLQMAHDRGKDWYEAPHRVWHTGHIHHDSVREFNAEVKVESHRTLAAKDKYSDDHGYSSGRTLKCILYHNEFGEVERHTVSVEMIASKSQKGKTNRSAA